jgi:hypothetical protein
MLGEYAGLLRRRGAAAASAASPAVVAHLSYICPACRAALVELLRLVDLDRNPAERPWLAAVRRRLVHAQAPVVDGAPVPRLIVVEFAIPQYPELLLRGVRTDNGSLAQLVVREQARAAPVLAGWKLQVSPAGGAPPVRGLTTAAGAARLAWLPLEAFVTATVRLRPPGREGLGPIPT